MWKVITAISIATTLTGCASTFEAMGRDPVRVEKISASDKDVIATVSLSAEKRNVLVSLNGDKKGFYCAEPPPEVAKAFDIDRTNIFEGEGQLTPEQKAKLKAELKEKTKEAITVLAQRTVLLDVYRTGTYSLCQFYVNGAIDKQQLLEQFSKLSTSVVNALSQPTPAK